MRITRFDQMRSKADDDAGVDHAIAELQQCLRSSMPSTATIKLKCRDTNLIISSNNRMKLTETCNSVSEFHYKFERASTGNAIC